MKYYLRLFLPLFCLASLNVNGQSVLSGQLQSEEGPVIYSNVALYLESDSTLYKVETSDDNGLFTFRQVRENNYFLVASYVGLQELRKENINIAGKDIDLGQLSMSANSVQLETAVVVAQRALVEVKPDRTVFNVEGTINSVGDDGLNLLRKAPGVLLDNNNNVSVLGRTGVIFYVDGKRIPLAGDDLTNYLQNIPAEQIDRIDIITNPGAKYEAEGNAGIIDLRLKKDKSLGANGSLSSTYSKGRKHRSNISSSANYRNKKMNLFGTAGYTNNIGSQIIIFDGYRQTSRLLNRSDVNRESKGYNVKLGTDFFLSKNHTLGFLVSRDDSKADNQGLTSNIISFNTDVDNFDTTPEDVTIPFEDIDSIQLAESNSLNDIITNTFNLNYLYNDGNNTLSIDGDYGQYIRTTEQVQPNTYTDRNNNVTSTSNFSFSTPVDIDISTLKIDYETNGLNGKIGLGAKYGNVSTDNTFLFFNGLTPDTTINASKSNLFDYSEKVIAGYLSYATSLNEKWNLTTGLRTEHTNSRGTLTVFDSQFSEPPTEQNYLSFFPSFGLTYAPQRGNTWSFNYGRRINRPDYVVLNPFRTQLSELDFAIGNPNLRPEIVNNAEIGYTYKYRFNFKLAYSLTTDKITRLIGTDDSDPRASFINHDNLAEQQVINLSTSLPFQINDFWSAFFNASVNYQKNNAEYPDGNVIDVDAWGYNFFQQHTFKLGKGFSGELSGWFSGPGIWGGVFIYESSYSVNLGLQKRFLNDQLNAKIGFNDLFDQSFWSGFSDFDNLLQYGQGDWDARRFSVSLSYNFGNNNVKSRKRKTGLEDEKKRVGQG